MTFYIVRYANPRLGRTVKCHEKNAFLSRNQCAFQTPSNDAERRRQNAERTSRVSDRKSLLLWPKERSMKNLTAEHEFRSRVGPPSFAIPCAWVAQVFNHKSLVKRDPHLFRDIHAPILHSHFSAAANKTKNENEEFSRRNSSRNGRPNLHLDDSLLEMRRM